MKVCVNCGSEDVGNDGENLCPLCDYAIADDNKNELANQRRKLNRKAREQALRDCGLVKVRGALGGVYWE